jgi:hypothetical protein
VQQASRYFCTLTLTVSVYNAVADNAVKTRTAARIGQVA